MPSNNRLHFVHGDRHLVPKNTDPSPCLLSIAVIDFKPLSNCDKLSLNSVNSSSLPRFMIWPPSQSIYAKSTTKFTQSLLSKYILYYIFVFHDFTHLTSSFIRYSLVLTKKQVPVVLTIRQRMLPRISTIICSHFVHGDRHPGHQGFPKRMSDIYRSWLIYIAHLIYQSTDALL